MPPDLAALATGFSRAVHDAGIASSPERTVRFARALELLRPTSRTRLYWTARSVFVSSQADLKAFDAVFARVFDGIVDPADTRGDQGAQPLEGAAPELAAEVAEAVRRLRSQDIQKRPGIAEAIDWVAALQALGADRLDAESSDRTLGAVLKYREDQELVRERGLASLLPAGADDAA